MNKVEEAALLLFGMGEENAAKVMQHLSKQEVEDIIAAMSKLKSQDAQKVTRIIDHFVNASKNESQKTVDLSQGSLDEPVNQPQPQPSPNSSNKVKEYTSTKGIKDLNWQPDFIVSDLIRSEHPQIIAVVLSYLDRDKAARVLQLLPKYLQADILQRICTLGPLSPLALSEMEKILSEQLQETIVFKEAKSGGVEASVEIINYLDSTLESEIIHHIRSDNEELYQEIQERIFPFARLLHMKSADVKKLIRRTSNTVLAYALKGADDEVKEFFFNNLSEISRAKLLSDIENLGLVKVSEVQEAQKKIITLAQKMFKDGEIVIFIHPDDLNA